LALKDGSRVRLLSRNLKDATRQYPSVARAVALLGAETAILDGEVVAVDEGGRPSFQALHHQSAHTIVYYVFDLLHLDGRDLTMAPLDQRREFIAKTLKGTPVLRSEPLPGTPAQIEEAVRQLHLEGVVAKRRESRYEPGKRSRSWVKVKFNRRQEFVVGGFKPNANAFESLLVGYYEGRKLMFASKVRAGLTPHIRAELFPALKATVHAHCPFANLPSSKTGHWGEGITAADMAALRWVKPMIVVEVSFVEWTRDGLLRHPEFVGVRDTSHLARFGVRTDDQQNAAVATAQTAARSTARGSGCKCSVALKWAVIRASGPIADSWRTEG
jgi:bifunctional non-homologous end joining protein LigD